MLTYILALLAAMANATSWVLQRKANREVAQESLSLRLMRDLLHKPVWIGGIAAITAGFVLQAAALGTGALAVVEPILVLELPFTLLLGSWMFRTRISHREWMPSLAMTLGVGLLLFLLSPSPGREEPASWYTWVLAIGANVALVAFLLLWTVTGSVRLRTWRKAVETREREGRGSLVGRSPLNGQQQAALLGVAAGGTFGLTAALIKGMTGTFAGGFVALLTSWQLYAVIAAGAMGMFLTQSALNAGPLTASQPGNSLTDPILAVLWGVFVFGEQVRGGWLILPQVLCGVVVCGAAIVLARSPLFASG
ncbi:MAG TPA: DMT family transporter [Streptosporangiaceae bacterium]